jgi:hypothetical protein
MTLVSMPRACDPGGASGPGPRDESLRFGPDAVAFHGPSRVGPTTTLFRGLPSWPAHPLSTLRSRPRGAGHARLAPRRPSSALPERDFHPRVTSRGFCSLHGFLLSQAFAWRNETAGRRDGADVLVEAGLRGAVESPVAASVERRLTRSVTCEFRLEVLRPSARTRASSIVKGGTGGRIVGVRPTVPLDSRWTVRVLPRSNATADGGRRRAQAAGARAHVQSGIDHPGGSSAARAVKAAEGWPRVRCPCAATGAGGAIRRCQPRDRGRASGRRRAPGQPQPGGRHRAQAQRYLRAPLGPLASGRALRGFAPRRLGQLATTLDRPGRA